MKTTFEDTYKHPIDLERFIEEYEWEDNEISTSYTADQIHNEDDSTISSKSPTSSSGSYCSTKASSGEDSSETLTDSDSNIPPPPPNTPEERRDTPSEDPGMRTLTNRLNDVIQALVQFNNNHPTLPSNPRRSDRNTTRPSTYSYTGRAYRQDRKK